MTPEEINKLNQKDKEKRKQSNSKSLKYCYTCKRNREVLENEWTCPICKNHLQPTSPTSYQNSQPQYQPQPQPQNIPKCPTCGSTNISKISGIKRAVLGYAFGLFSKTARSQFECKNCGYKW